jgi:KDO2-lipid IV(A) lauroyltransferase
MDKPVPLDATESESISFAHRFEAWGVRLLLRFLRVLSIDAASNLGGRFARTIGPRLGIHRRAVRHISRALPELSEDETQEIARDMWDNLGRTIAEFAKLDALNCYAHDGRIEVRGAEHIDALKKSGGAAIFFSGHFANWEIMPLSVTQRGLPVSLVYRSANNPVVNEIILKMRRLSTHSNVPKGAAGARQLISIVRDGGVLGILVDQKLNTGIPVPLMGRDAMTAPAMAQLALKFNVPLIPISVVRKEGARFLIDIEPPLDLNPTGDRAADTLRIMTNVNAILERWIRANPAQWLWLHRRWPD